ncbi:MAG: hypothetical protein IIY51_06625 [Erysipelotrichaceae bacterium]|nr:hypothetical protein [Erysipelotrichaceae bacterium]
MKNTDLLRAMTDIDDEFIEEAARKRTSLIPSGFSLRTAASLAMVAVAIIGVIIIRPQLGLGRKMEQAPDQFVYEYHNQTEGIDGVGPSAVSNKANESQTFTQEEIINDNRKKYLSDDGRELYTVIKTRDIQTWNLPEFTHQGIYDYKDYSVHVYGNDPDTVCFAQWERNGYHYSISFAQPYDVQEALKIIAGTE